MPMTQRVAAVGDTLKGRYPVHDIIASGGQGIVLSATDTLTNTPVAIKQLLTDPSKANHASELGRFTRAASIRIGHPAVLDPLDSFTDNGWFTVFPLLSGGDLESKLKAKSMPMCANDATKLIRQVAGGLGSAHDQGIIHRDIKPANIFLTDDGKPMILDFGIARNIREQTLTPSSCVIGSPPYMAPEQFFRVDVDSRADLYGVGVLLYLLLTGTHPRPGSTDEEITRNAQSLIPTPPKQLNPAIPARLDDVCTRLLSINPDGRPGSAMCLIEELDSTTKPVVRCLACGHRINNTKRCSGCNREFPSKPYRLEFIDGPAANQSFLIPDGVFECGRHQLCPSDLRISRRQLGIGCGNGLWIRTATNPPPPNPTLINGLPANESILVTEGTRISIADNDAVVRAG